jgi:AmiR/NasT family two-component response regulator
MTSVLLLANSSQDAETVLGDLSAVGLDVHGASDCSNVLHQVIRFQPDLLVCVMPTPGARLFESLASVASSAARPVALFTSDPDVEKMNAALRSGVHAYVVSGYSRGSVRSVLHLAQARFEHERVLQQELAELRTRYEERKLVDRAKGILMGARQLREEEAFRALRSAAMASKQRIGQVSNLVIDSARYAEATNRAGQLRMLSQRVVKIYALMCLGIERKAQAELFAASIDQANTLLATLNRNLSRPTFGDLLDSVAKPWTKLQAVARLAGNIAHLTEIDALAEQVLERAEILTANLEIAAYAPALNAINVAGRQRMLSQRVAKQALVRALRVKTSGPSNARRDDARGELVKGLAYLSNLPLSNADISCELKRTVMAWEAFQGALDDEATAAGQTAIAATSETLLAHFDQLTDLIERGVQAFIGLL